MDDTQARQPKNSKIDRIGRSNTTDSGQILSHLAIKQGQTYLQDYGIDKLNFSFRTDNGSFKWNGQQPDEWTEQLTQKKGGKPQRKLFRNTPHYQATIETFRDIDTFLRIQLNPSKILHPYKLTTDRAIIFDQLTGLADNLELSGIKIRLEDAEVNRIDIANNMELNETFESYANVMDAFQGKRQLKKQHDTTRYWTNTQHQFIIYPKSRELKKNILGGGVPDREITRGEMKFFNKEVIKIKFGTERLGEVIAESIFSDVFNQYVRDIVFKENQYKEQRIEFAEQDELYKKMIEQFGNKGFGIFLKSFGVLNLLQSEKAIDDLGVILKRNHNKRTANRHIQELNKLVNIYKESFYHLTPEFIRRSEELHNKLLIYPKLRVA